MTEPILQRIFGLGRRRRRRIFISYRRRGDSAGYGGRIADSLVEHFGRDQCFLDVEHIEPGVDFVTCIEEGIGACDVLIVVIGPDWTSQIDGNGRPRLQDPRDWVRIEVAAALRRNVRVIPTLVGGAHIPAEDEVPEDLRDLCHRQAHELSDSRWSYDVHVLLQTIEKAGVKALASRTQLTVRQKTKMAGAAVFSCGFVVTAVLGIDYLRFSKIPDLPVPNNLIHPPPSAWKTDPRPVASSPRPQVYRGDLESKAEIERKARERIERQLAETQRRNEQLARSLAEQQRRQGEEAKLGLVEIAQVEPKPTATSPVVSVKPAGKPEPEPVAAARSTPNITSVHQVKRLYIDQMPNDLDQFIRAEISKQLNGIITVVLGKDEADAILSGTGENRTGAAAQITGRYLGLHDTATGAVSLTDRTGTRVLWSSEAGDRSLLFGTMRRAGPRKVAERLVKNLKKALEQR
jgi:hypothetical protein